MCRLGSGPRDCSPFGECRWGPVLRLNCTLGRHSVAIWKQYLNCEAQSLLSGNRHLSDYEQVAATRCCPRTHFMGSSARHSQNAALSRSTQASRASCHPAGLELGDRNGGTVRTGDFAEFDFTISAACREIRDHSSVCLASPRKSGCPNAVRIYGVGDEAGCSNPSDSGSKAGEAKVNVAKTPLRVTGESGVNGGRPNRR